MMTKEEFFKKLNELRFDVTDSNDEYSREHNYHEGGDYMDAQSVMDLVEFFFSNRNDLEK